MTKQALKQLGETYGKFFGKGKLTSHGSTLGHTIFGKNIPERTWNFFDDSPMAYSKDNAEVITRAINFDPTLRPDLETLFMSAVESDDALNILDGIIDNFKDEDKMLNQLNQANRSLAKKQRQQFNTGQTLIDEAPTATGGEGRKATAYLAQVGDNAPESLMKKDGSILENFPGQAGKTTTPVDYKTLSQFSGTRSTIPGDTITEVHHAGPLDKLLRLITGHRSYQGVTPNSPSPLIQKGDELFGIKLGNSPQNTVDILGWLNTRGRQAKKRALYEQVGSVMHEKTIDDLLGTSDFQPRTLDYKTGNPELEKLNLETEHFKRLQQQDPSLTVERYMAENKSPITGSAYGKGGVTTKIEIWDPRITDISKRSGNKPLEVIKLTEATYPDRVKLAFNALKKHGIENVDTVRNKWDKKLAEIDSDLDILGVDHPHVHKLIDELEKIEGSALYKIKNMTDDEIFNLSFDDAFKLYVQQMQEAETILANVLKYRYEQVKNIFADLNPDLGKDGWEQLNAEEKNLFFRRNVNTIAVKADVQKDIGLKEATEEIRDWDNHISDTFGWRPQSLWTTIEQIEEIAKEFEETVPVTQPIPGVE